MNPECVRRIRFARSKLGVRVILEPFEKYLAVRAFQPMVDLDPYDLVVGIEILNSFFWARKKGIHVMQPPCQEEFEEGQRMTFDPCHDCIYVRLSQDRMLRPRTKSVEANILLGPGYELCGIDVKLSAARANKVLSAYSSW